MMLHTGFGMGVDIHSDDTAGQSEAKPLDKQFNEIKLLQKRQRERDRFEAACVVLGGLYANQYYMERWSKKEDDVVVAVETADALLAKLDRTEETEG